MSVFQVCNFFLSQRPGSTGETQKSSIYYSCMTTLICTLTYFVLFPDWWSNAAPTGCACDKPVPPESSSLLRTILPLPTLTIYYLYLYRKCIFKTISANRTTGIEPLPSLQSTSHFFFLSCFCPLFFPYSTLFNFQVAQQREGEVLSPKVLPVAASWAFPLLK